MASTWYVQAICFAQNVLFDPDPGIESLPVRVTKETTCPNSKMEIAEIEEFRRWRADAMQEGIDKLPLFTRPASGAIELLKTGKFADFIIICEGRSFNVHQSHLYPISDYFRTIIDGGFKESLSKSVELEDTNALAVGMLLLIIYAGQAGLYLDNLYCIWPELRPTTTLNLPGDAASRKQYLEGHFILELKTMIDVYVLADRLLIQHISAQAAEYVLWYIESLYLNPIWIEEADAGQFAGILEHVYLSLSETDLPLRKRIPLLCLMNHTTRIVAAGVEVIEKYDGYAWSLGKDMAQFTG